MLPLPPEYLVWLAAYPERTQTLFIELRRRMLEILPPCIEHAFDATNTVGSAFSFTDRQSEHFIHLPTYRDYVNLGFSQGASLDDPESRLKGSGARIRHIRLDLVDDLEDPYVRMLIEGAVRLANRPPEPLEPRTILHVMDGPKRRPKA